MASIRKRENSRGDVSYRVEIRLKGFPAQRATFKRKTDAKRWAQQTESAIREGRHFKTTEARKHTVADLIDRYIETVLPAKPKSYTKQKMQLEWWREAIGVYTVADISPGLIAEARDKLALGRGPATVVRYMAALSHAFTKAVREWEWLEHNPMSRVERPKEPRGRVRFLSDEERVKLLDACKESSNPNLYTIVVLALSTGMRQGEIMGLRWEDVDLQVGRVILHETKSEERRAVPIAGHCLKLLKEHFKIRRLDTDLLFPGNNPSTPVFIRAPWMEALTRSGIENFRFHDLRHSTASYLAMNGASLAEIADVLGHKTLQMVKRYAHLSETHTASVVASMNEKIFGAS